VPPTPTIVEVAAAALPEVAVLLPANVEPVDPPPVDDAAVEVAPAAPIQEELPPLLL
jgi:hypothetical protein